MKISINNFKSIGSIANYEIQPLTILSGTNSSGKSSFIHPQSIRLEKPPSLSRLKTLFQEGSV